MFCLHPTLATNHTVTLPELLFSREFRQSRQTEWLARQSSSLISFTVVIPGPIKDSEMTRKIFNYGINVLCQLAKQSGWKIKEQASFALATGPEGLIAIDAPAQVIKKAVIALEQEHLLGRLWDIDVVNPLGKILSRRDFALPGRRCLLCQRQAALCARERAHPIPDLITRMEALLHDADNAAAAQFHRYQ
jgi:holo-ACP synthase